MIRFISAISGRHVLQRQTRGGAGAACLQPQIPARRKRAVQMLMVSLTVEEHKRLLKIT